MNQSFQIASLISKKIKGEISSEEEKELHQWIAQSPSNEALYEKLLSDQTLLEKLADYQDFDRAKSWSAVEEKLFKAKVVRMETRRLLRYAAIIVPLVMLAGLSYYWGGFSSNPMANVDEIIKPYEQKATLTLANGEILDLQSKATTNIQEGSALLVNQNNSLTYTSEEEGEVLEPLIYNTLVTPRGGNYQLTLSDGTEVWLNASSSIKYPVVFTDSTRTIYLEGEAFFDVQHNGKPFIVNTEESNIRVLGTSFNVWAYADELFSATTLVEGSIKLSTSEMEQTLVPNEQASIFSSDKAIRIKEVHTNSYTSWMDGKIEFEDENLDAVMRRLARLYDFDYSFENKAAKDFHFTARIDNSQPISSIFKMLELTTKVEFKLNENTIIIH